MKRWVKPDLSSARLIPLIHASVNWAETRSQSAKRIPLIHACVNGAVMLGSGPLIEVFVD